MTPCRTEQVGPLAATHTPEASGPVVGHLLGLGGAGHHADEPAELVRHAGDVVDREPVALALGACSSWPVEW